MNINNSLLMVFSLILSLVFLEMVLRNVTPYPISWRSNKVYHEQLGYVLDSSMNDIDKYGFRNDSVTSIDIVTLGDSHTYGFNVRSSDSWPKVLGKILNKTIYNYGVGGYGVLQYQWLLERSVRFNPEAILLGLYLPNDLNDVCALVTSNKYWESRAKELNINSELCPGEKKPKKEPGSVVIKQNKKTLADHLKEKLATISIMTQYFNSKSVLKKINDGEIIDAIVINDKRVNTIIGAKRIRAHMEYMDLNRPHIQMAYEVLRNFLLEAKFVSNMSGIKFGVVFIPSKERVYYKHLLEMNYSVTSEYKELVSNEDKLRDVISIFLRNNDIPFVDILPDLEKAVLKDKNVYPIWDDGHPTDIGYKIYADNALNLYHKMNASN